MNHNQPRTAARSSGVGVFGSPARIRSAVSSRTRSTISRTSGTAPTLRISLSYAPMCFSTQARKASRLPASCSTGGLAGSGSVASASSAAACSSVATK